MIIREILELTQTENIPTIAKERLTIGEKRVRDILKSLGCTNERGKKGWTYTGDKPETLDQSIYDFVPKRTRKPTANKSDSKVASNNNSKTSSKVSNINSINNDIVNNSASNSNMKAEIQALIQNKPTNKPKKEYRGIYFDNDIAHFLDNVQHGNKSELVNKIIRAYLTENGLM